MRIQVGAAALVVLALATPAWPQTTTPGTTHEEHHRQMEKEKQLKENGGRTMGFDQDAAVHHFRLYADGGAIEVESVSAGGDTTRRAIRAHLRTIADDFANGNFRSPLETHGEMPAGVAELVRLRASVTYRYQDTPNGGRVRITTAHPDALSAVHAFLTYQIREHRTGDPLTVVK